jgi:isopentenyldiphosphate isomerase
MEDHQETYDIVDESGRATGRATRGECHADPKLMHRAVHALVFDASGQLFLQKRALAKTIQPGRWDASVGGHVLAGETFRQALVRETEEELGFRPSAQEFLYEYVWRCARETELIQTFRIIAPPGVRITLNRDEIMDGRFWPLEEVRETIRRSPEIFTPNFIHELQRFEVFLSPGQGGKTPCQKNGNRR